MTLPEMHFVVRWPDDTVETCYSPSLVVREHLVVGESYELAEFVERSRHALTIASERVREKHGFACSHSLRQIAAIEARALKFRTNEPARVAVEASTRTKASRGNKHRTALMSHRLKWSRKSVHR